MAGSSKSCRRSCSSVATVLAGMKGQRTSSAIFSVSAHRASGAWSYQRSSASSSTSSERACSSSSRSRSSTRWGASSQKASVAAACSNCRLACWKQCELTFSHLAASAAASSVQQLSAVVFLARKSQQLSASSRPRTCRRRGRAAAPPPRELDPLAVDEEEQAAHRARVHVVQRDRAPPRAPCTRRRAVT